MSIWCSGEEIGYERHRHNEWRNVGRGEVRSYATGFSNHYPTTDGEVEQPANIDVSRIPVWCVPGHADDDWDLVGPWLRLSVYTAEHSFEDGGKPTGRYDVASVVMDEAAARSLAADLLAWADQPKAHPTIPLPGPQR